LTSSVSGTGRVTPLSVSSPSITKMSPSGLMPVER
jgi:hypothetical protein